ncbi:MAG: dihydroorotate dehydrogenase [Verrucomicrobiota bacterium]|nr:dihydroorotate dehydrogenase [Verrucomicrobiota bacterium]
MMSIYDMHKTYADNVKLGPFFSGAPPKREPPKRFFDFLGFRVRSKIGVPAGPLLTSKWISLAGQLGFDLPTYKTIRSDAYPSHPLPNVAFVDGHGRQVREPLELTITNSFGMPSQSPDFLLQDIERANRSLAEGQVMIVSVVGTPRPDRSFVQDFIRAAQLAKEGGAKIVEANFSCPNVEKAEGILYQNPDTVYAYTRAIAQAISPIPLILKVGVFEGAEPMEAVFVAAARGGARAICGINSVSMKISPPLDDKRSTSGVCGGAIREKALQFIRDGSKMIRDNQLGLTLIGCGGIMAPEHFTLFFEAGADVAMSATGMMWDPYLARRYHAHLHSHPQTV